MENTTSQWDNLLLNLGAWQGSFTRLSPQGIVQSDIPTLVTLEGRNEQRTVHQTIQHFSPETGEMTQNKVLEYSSLSRSILLFDNGAFSQGSIQAAPFSEFGAEHGFIQNDRRLRLVQLFDEQNHLASLTLIREHRKHTPVAERPPLSLEQLVGDWQGESVTLYPDWRSPDRSPTTLSIRREGDNLHQHLTAPGLEVASTARIHPAPDNGHPWLRFEQGAYPMHLLLLPDGASSTTPLVIPRGIPFFLEAGWLVAENVRYRMIRHYDAQGGWVNLTLVTERRIRTS